MFPLKNNKVSYLENILTNPKAMISVKHFQALKTITKLIILVHSKFIARSAPSRQRAQ